jgi:CMP-N-acetylneuraminic acid synthetase
MNNQQKITAMIGVRKNSVRVKNKNIKQFYDTTLLDLKIKTLLKCKNIDNILVTSDCDDMLNIAKKYNVLTDKRPDYYASSECSTADYFKYLSTICPTYNMIYCPVTSPFIYNEDYDEMIEKYNSESFQKNYDSLTTTEELNDFIYVKKKPLLFDSENLPKSQDIKNIEKLTFGCSILPKDLLMKRSFIFGYKPYFFKMNNSLKNIDIDNESDFVISELLYKNNII